MKSLILTTLLIGFSLAQAETVDSVIFESGDWKAIKVTDHLSSKKEACLARTKAKTGDFTIEVYAEKSPAGGYVEPLVQIIGHTNIQPMAAMLKPLPGRSEFAMSIALSESTDPVVDETTGEITKGQQVLLSRLNERKDLISLIGSANSIEATILEPGKPSTKVSFSLKGSSKTIRKMLERCQVPFAGHTASGT